MVLPPEMAEATPTGPSGEDPPVLHWAGGCACCTAAPAFSLALVKLFRAGPWDRLLVAADPAAVPQAIADALRDGPLRAAIGEIDLVSVAPDGQVRGPREVFDPVGVDPLDALRTPWPLLEWPDLQQAMGRRAGALAWRWLPGEGVPFVPGAPQASPRARMVGAPGGRPAPTTLGWVWGADRVFERAPLLSALDAAAAARPDSQWYAVLRTRREWYAGTARGGRWEWAPASTRYESRIECRFGRPDDADAHDDPERWAFAHRAG